MAIRTGADAVGDVIETDSDISLTPFIRTASALVDYISSKDSQSLLTTPLLTEIETYLAAHFYALRDPQYQSKTTAQAGATFQGQTGKFLELTWWGQQAIALDVSGGLAELSRQRHKVGVSWLGLAPSDQTDYEDRD